MSDTLLELRSITKSYPGVQALRGVDLSVGKGEVVGLIGENGAGKSTLMKILGGVVKPSSGSIVIDGESRTALSVKDAAHAGIAFVHQELHLFENLDVAANIYIGREPRRGGFLNLIDNAALHQRVKPLLRRLGVDFAPDDPVDALSIAQRQMVEIAKALSMDARIIIMDEPTSSLTLTETDKLLSVIADLKAAGVSIIYISHRLSEVKHCADRVVVLRDGRQVGELPKGQITSGAMVRLMIGRDLKSLYIPPKVGIRRGGLELRNFVTSAFPERDVSLMVHRGEILGLAGLVGAGRTSLAQTIFGVHTAKGGQILLDGEPVTIRTPADAIAHGIYLAPEDRKKSGLLLDMSIAENISLPDLKRFAKAMLVDTSREVSVATEQCRSLSIKAPSIDTDAVTLSGGNQQKVVLAKWISMAPQLIIFDEPTRGIDVGAKGEIYALMRGLADAGVAILMISSDMEEVIGVSDRIAVMHEGGISGILDRSQFSEHNVLTLAVGNLGKEDLGKEDLGKEEVVTHA
ncbi:ribose transport system ATP-binding protein [Skermanella aerolata]|uniref:Sugar ABC transporter ATP-binding protein n=1 Tax=Skermanella aerolata TaxID=393310 RepID=A0A512DVS8_9PROT|nr:sugar ABC transporter ATP-binding protein [Skermanella aerolata]KJB94512.1 D-ribose transporter ATP binding protein [Skermanella aerolata KACC 11604]GEO40574.1 sugar ABC transporter ATP-binding protein [Skermanella aerolata]